MLVFALRRFVLMVFTMLAVTVIVFSLSRLQGDPRNLYLSNYTTQEQWEAWGKEMGLDRSLIVQYLVWVGKAVRGDLGEALRESRPVTEVMQGRWPNTLQLGGAAFIFAFITGVPLGVLSAVKRGSLWDYIGRGFAAFGQALPPFWVGLMLIFFFAVRLDLLPSARKESWVSFILPTITLGWLFAAGNLRLIRSSMLEILDSEYIKLARAKGVPEWRVVWKHALKNASIAPLTFAAVTMASLLMGAVVTETVFAWPGMGRLAVEAVFFNDFALLTGVVMVFAAIFVGAAFLVDMAYAYIDPRIRYR